MGRADTLLAMGGPFLAAAFLARLGNRIGLPTIPVCGPPRRLSADGRSGRG
ncbi:hypothetical protein [Streptomyces sp. NPDC005859]|uniref:hypothetical protein n=1 Tax=Streptomyces sp. NPDC005859 TaxID=3157170 RepID=UPI003404596D